MAGFGAGHGHPVFLGTYALVNLSRSQTVAAIQRASTHLLSRLSDNLRALGLAQVDDCQSDNDDRREQNADRHREFEWILDHLDRRQRCRSVPRHRLFGMPQEIERAPWFG